MIRALNVAGLSEVEKRVVKATYDDDDPPKPKHVEALILLSADHELLPYLDRRIISHNWNVCLKTIIVMHKLALEGDDRFLSEVASSSSLFSLPQQFDVSVDPTATAHTAFIQAYAAYMQAKIESFTALKLSIERYTPSDSQKWAMKLTSSQLCKILPKLQKQFDRILLTSPRNSEDQNHPITISAISLCIKDAFRLYSVLTILMLVVLERYEAMDLKQTSLMLKCTQRFLVQNKKFKVWAQKLCKIGMVEKKLMPNFDAIPSTFLQLLEEHIVALGGVVENPTPDQKEEEVRGKPRSTRGRGRGGKAPLVKRRSAKYEEEEEGEEEEEKGEEEEEEEQKPAPKAARGRASTRGTGRGKPAAARPTPRRRAVEEEEVDDVQYEDEAPPPRAKPAATKRAPAAPKAAAAKPRARQAEQYQEEEEEQEEYEEEPVQPAPRVKRAPVSRPPPPVASALPLDLLDDQPNVLDLAFPSQPKPAVSRQPSQRSAAPAPAAQPARRPPATSAPTQQPTRQAQPLPRQAKSPPPPQVYEDEYDDYQEEQYEEEEEADPDDPLALYVSSSVPSRPAAPVAPLSTKSRGEAKAKVAAALNHELNLFDNFDPLTLHPAEQQALDRQQQSMQAMFTAPPPSSQSTGISTPPPPYNNAVIPYETDGGDEGYDGEELIDDPLAFVAPPKPQPSRSAATSSSVRSPPPQAKAAAPQTKAKSVAQPPQPRAATRVAAQAEYEEEEGREGVPAASNEAVGLDLNLFSDLNASMSAVSIDPVSQPARARPPPPSEPRAPAPARGRGGARAPAGARGGRAGAAAARPPPQRRPPPPQQYEDGEYDEQPQDFS